MNYPKGRYLVVCSRNLSNLNKAKDDDLDVSQYQIYDSSVNDIIYTSECFNGPEMAALYFGIIKSVQLLEKGNLISGTIYCSTHPTLVYLARKYCSKWANNSDENFNSLLKEFECYIENLQCENADISYWDNKKLGKNPAKFKKKRKKKKNQ